MDIFADLNTRNSVENFVLENDKVVVAVSGGPDSMLVLYWLKSLVEKFNVEVIVAHVNHGLREESKEEEKFVRDFAKSAGFKCIVKHLDMKNIKGNMHDAAHNERTAFFKEVAKNNNCSKIFYGHHGDDLIETVLMRIGRGSFLDGYAGMQPQRVTDGIMYVRPLLNYEKTQIKKYCDLKKLEYIVDNSNNSTKYLRNRIRETVLPILKEEFPKIVEKTGQFSNQVNMLSSYTKRHLDVRLNDVIKQDENGLFVYSEFFSSAQSLSAMYCMQLIYKKFLNKQIELSNRYYELIIKLIKSPRANAKLNFPDNVLVKRVYDKIYFVDENKLVTKKDKLKITLSDFGQYNINDNVDVVFKPYNGDLSNIGNSNSLVILDMKNLKLPITIRTREAGDKIITASGTKKLKKIFIDKKVPIDKRDDIPILVDSEGNILLVLGYAKSNLTYLPKTKINSEKVVDKYVQIKFLFK